jgi:phosphatidylglycerophosphate synthase
MKPDSSLSPPTQNGSSSTELARSQEPGSRLPIVLYVPNLLCYARVVLSFAGLYYSIAGAAATAQSKELHQSASETESAGPVISLAAVTAISCWIVAIVLDFFDGIAARALQQTSQYGVLLDIVSDNILRSSVWIAAAIQSIVASAPCSAKQSFLVVPLVACGIICIEWFTMVATQVEAATSTTNNSWKERGVDPWIVREYFRNNFRNPIGMVGIFGMFTANLFVYSEGVNAALQCLSPPQHQVHILYYYSIWKFLAYAGRLISLGVEFHFCRKFMSRVLQQDYQDKNK